MQLFTHSELSLDRQIGTSIIPTEASERFVRLSSSIPSEASLREKSDRIQTLFVSFEENLSMEYDLATSLRTASARLSPNWTIDWRPSRSARDLKCTNPTVGEWIDAYDVEYLSRRSNWMMRLRRKLSEHGAYQTARKKELLKSLKIILNTARTVI